MNLKLLSKDDLMNRLSKLTQTERKITHLILECLNEIELRRLHLEMGYSSLYYLLTEKYGYTPASAQRRIDGARLLRQVPTLADKLESGDLNLTKASMIQKSIKQAEKESNIKYTKEQKQILVEKVSQAQGTIEQTQVLLAQELNLSIPTPHEKTQHHRDASVTITMHFTAEEMEQIKQVRDLLSNSTGSLELKDLFIYLAKRELKKYEKKSTESKTISPMEMTKDSSIQNATSKSSSSISTKTKRSLLNPQASCTYKDPKTKHQCKATVFLSMDHLTPQFAGGGHESENLQVLCKNHNIHRYKKHAGIERTAWS